MRLRAAAPLALACTLLASVVAPARGETTAADPLAVALAGESGLEPGPGRRAFVITLGLGLAVQRGRRIDANGGLGGLATVRVMRVASPAWLIGISLDVVNSVNRSAPGEALEVSQQSFLTVGGQIYARPGLWFRLGAGVTVFAERALSALPSLVGLGGTAGAGVVLVQRRSLSLQIEAFGALGIYQPGALAAGGMMLSLAID